MGTLLATAALALLMIGLASALCANAACCKICRKGKACGNTCSAADKTCHTTSGCACDA